MKNNYIKKYSFIIMLTLLISTVSASANNISWLNYTDGMAKAKAEGKKVYIHFYADWCHYCKVMAKTTFKDASVITFLNDKFIPIRVDTVKEKKLARDYLVRGLPSNWFLEPDGKRIGMKPGYLKPKQFLENLKFVHEEQYKPKKNNIISDKAVSIEHIKHLIETTDHPGNFGDSVRPACVFLLFSQREELYVTVILKADNKGYPWANQIALPGGHIDPNETPVETVFRELKEELNISSPHVDLIGSMGHFMTINNIQIQVFAGVWNEKEKIQFDKKEIAKVFTLPFTDFIQTHFDNSFNGRIPGWDELIYPVEDAMMWGATAKIMHYLIELIYTN